LKKIDFKILNIEHIKGSMTSITSTQFLTIMPSVVLNDKGAISFSSTTNPILDLFTETRKKIPTTIEEFTKLVRKIEAAKNHNSELFIKLLKFHRLINKGNGMKGIYYICMMILKEEDPEMYERILEWSYQYPKDILRLARLGSMFGGNAAKSSFKQDKYGEYPTIVSKNSLYYTKNKNPKGKNGKKITKWLLTEKKNGNLTTIGLRSDPMQLIKISAEIELYAQLVAKTLLLILDGNLYSTDVNLFLFKYLSYENGHFAIETKNIWSRVNDIIYHKFQNE
jgi:hypothetical protein